MNLPGGWFEAYSPITSNAWTHVILNYLGPFQLQGIQIYVNGENVAAQPVKSDSSTFSAGDGRIVVGRLLTDSDQGYASVMVDELIYFNTQLNFQDIEALNDLYEGWNFVQHVQDIRDKFRSYIN